MPLILETSGLTKLYGGRAAVNQVSLHVKEGDIYGFIGKNGAGKTTFMRLVTGLARPDKGSMTLFGGQSFTEGRRRIGSMIEYPSLYPNMTARENLEAHRRLLGIPEKNSVDEALQTVHLTDTGNKKVSISPWVCASGWASPNVCWDIRIFSFSTSPSMAWTPPASRKSATFFSHSMGKKALPSCSPATF